jgi:pullulanase
VGCDKDVPAVPTIPDQAALPSNNHLVIYELPISWVNTGGGLRGVEIGVGTFKGVVSPFDVESHVDRSSATAAVRHEALLMDLGINALELLPGWCKTRKESGVTLLLTILRLTATSALPAIPKNP